MPNNPIQIADAALYLSKTQPSLGITDPYELTEAQLNAAVNLLKQQRPLIKKYWALAVGRDRTVQERRRRRSAPRGRYQYNTLMADKVPVAETDPDRGRDRLGGHVDALRARQAPELRLQMGELGVEPESAGRAGDLLRRDARQHEGVPVHGRDQEGLVHRLPRERAGGVLQQHQVLEDAGARECGNGQNNCMDYSAWQQKWTEVTG